MSGYLPERQVWATPVTLRRLRRLETGGQVVVGERGVVRPDDVVIRGEVAGEPLAVPVARLLELADPSLDRYLTRRPGEPVRQGEVIARVRGFFGLGARTCVSPASGVLELGADGSGQVFVVPAPQELRVLAHYPGTVVSVIPGRGVVIEFTAVGLQGIVGCGGDSGGRLVVLAGPTEPISADRVSQRLADAVLVGGSADSTCLRQAAEAGVRGVVVGSLRASAYEACLAESRRLPLVVTEGFGLRGMSRRCFELLRQHEGREARIRGGEGAEAGEPPEVVVPVRSPSAPRARPPALELGALVRIAAGPRALAVGQVVAVGAAPGRCSSGHISRWIDVKLDDEVVRVPVPNVELVGF